MAENTTTEADGGATPVSTTGNEQGGSETSKLFIFPSDVELSGHFLKLMVFKYSRAVRANPAVHPEKQADIILPMPSNLSTTYSADYNTGALDYAGSVMEPYIGNAIDTLKKVHTSFNNGENTNVYMSVMDQLKSFGNLVNVDFVGGYVAYQALDALEDSELGRAAQLTGGFARNPHLALLFRGVGFRTHSFQYNFVARNMQEAIQLRDLLRYLRAAMLPSYNDAFDNHLFNYPYEFEISMSNEAFTFHIGESVLTDLRINYHAAGRPLYFNAEGEIEVGRDENNNAVNATGKPPVAVSVEMDFTETQIVTRESVERENR